MAFDLGEALGKLTGNSTVNQLFTWQIAGQLVSAALSPFFLEIQHIVNEALPLVPLSPADAASAVVRGFLSEADGAGDAAKSGVGSGVFHTMTQLAGTSIAPDAAASALRRGIMPRDSGNPDTPGFIQAIQQGDLRDIWIPVVEALALATPSPTDAVAAYVKGQIDEDTSKSYYKIFGGDPQYWQMMFNTEGTGPSPDQAALAARRGIIPWDGIGPGVTSFSQAVHESASRDKWEPVYKALAEYYPPPRTVSAMFKAGDLTADQARTALSADGVPESFLNAYMPGQTGDPQSDTKKLALSTVETLYADKLISNSDATTAITGLGYSPEDAALILAIQDLRTEMSQLSTMVGHIRSLYLAYKITDTEAVNALNALNLPGNQVPGIIQLWQTVRLTQTANLTAAEIADAWNYGILDQSTAITQLQALGYTPADAWTYLSIKNKGPLPGNPGGAIVARPNQPTT